MPTSDAAYSTDLRLRAEKLAVEVPWFHSIRLFDDLTTNGAKTPSALATEAEKIFDLLRLNGLSLLDIGSWNGYFAFEAKRRGAARVVASDHFTWRHPGYRGRETFRLARECLQLDIEDVEIDATNLPGDLGSFDVVLFLGVFYHLFDPIAVLERVSSMATRLLVIETDLALPDLAGPAMRYWPRGELGEDVTNWWSPNIECMYELLRSVGFNYILYQKHPLSTQRGFFHAFRSTRDAADHLLAHITGVYELDSAEDRKAIFASADDLAQRLADAEAARVKAECKLAKMKRTPSWRLTQPIRSAARAIRHRRRRD